MKEVSPVNHPSAPLRAGSGHRGAETISQVTEITSQERGKGIQFSAGGFPESEQVKRFVWLGNDV
jgi:hypothetical protein